MTKKTDDDLKELLKEYGPPSDPSIVFVFGSNTAGHHGAGAALDAKKYWGAIYGDGYGPQGESYAIATLDGELNQRHLDDIDCEVFDFMIYALDHPDTDFQVTAIGCGLAGFKPEDIAPMFRAAPRNCHLPLAWKPLLRRPMAVASME